MAHGVLYADAFSVPLSVNTARVQLMPLSYYVFYITGTTTPAVIYQDGNLNTPFPSNVVTANSNGVFVGIFLDPAQVYRVQLFDRFNRRVKDWDPYIACLSTFSTTQLRVNAVTGQVAINPTSPGGAGAALTLIARPGGTALNTGSGAVAGNSEMYLLYSGLTGASTATFGTTNKPGGVNTLVTKWLPIQVGGFPYFIPLWA